jgi:RNA polymerase sigma factor (sigma-70 family)
MPKGHKAMEGDPTLLNLYRSGDTRAADELFHRYVNRLVALARSRLSRKLARRLDPEDIVQSAYRSFFVGAREGKYTLTRGSELWGLLAAITLNKLHRQIERNTAGKRAISLEHSFGSSSSSQYLLTAEAIAREPSPSEAMAGADELEQLMNGVDDLHRRMLELRLQGHTMDEIATETGRSERTVRRVIEKVKARLQQQAMQSMHP